MQFRRVIAPLVWVVVALVALAACGQGGTDLSLSQAGSEGRDLAIASGCASCHGKDGQGITAPSWQGIYRTQVPVEAGGTVFADDAYLVRSITDPQADIVADYNIKMPSNKLTDDEVASIVAFIKELS